MTLTETLEACIRRWYVVLIAVGLGLGASAAAVRTEGVYWSRAEVTFLAPMSKINPNVLRATSTDLIVSAGAVAKRVNGNATWDKMADPAATIVGQGVLDGWSVKLPDYGGQWSTVYSRNVLEVQVSGPTAEVVRDRQSQIFATIDEELDFLQEGVVPADRISTTVVPARPSVQYIHGSTTRALIMIWVLCVAAAYAVLNAVGLPERHAMTALPHDDRRLLSAWRTR